MRIKQCVIDYRKHRIKGLSEEQKRLHWEAYAKKTERQEEMFKKVFNDVVMQQGREIADNYRTTGQLPNDLNDENTAKRFEGALEMVYEDALENAI